MIVVRLSLGRTSESILAFIHLKPCTSFAGVVKQGGISYARNNSTGSTSRPFNDDKLGITDIPHVHARRNAEVFSQLPSSKRQDTLPDNEEVVEYKVLKTNLEVLNDNPAEPEHTSILATRRVDPTLVHQVYYFDTLAFVKKLELNGFSRQQAEGCAESLVEVINTTLDHQGRHMVTKLQQEVAVQQLLSEIASVKKDMTLLQKTEFSSLKTDTEKMSVELSQIQGHMNDEIVKLKGQFSLDINLERGRAIEAHAENEKRLQMLHNKIDTEVANLKTTYEVYRNDVFKYAGGTVIAVATLVLGVLRLWH